MLFRGIAFTIWYLWDPIYYLMTRLTKVNGSSKSIFRVRLTSYKGRKVRLSDGTYIEPNDVLLKIHLHNVVLLKETLRLKSDIQKGVYLYRTIEQALPDLSRFLRNHPKCGEIKGIIGITMLNRSGNLGFEVVPLVNRLYKLYKWICLMPIYAISVSQPFRKIKKLAPVYLFMSKETLFTKYGD